MGHVAISLLSCHLHSQIFSQEIPLVNILISLEISTGILAKIVSIAFHNTKIAIIIDNEIYLTSCLSQPKKCLSLSLT